MRFDACWPTKLVFGAGRLAEAGALARTLGGRALVITSRSAMSRLGYTERLLQGLATAGVEARVFHDLGPTPTTDDVENAAVAARSMKADLMIGLGGGSAIDCAKAVAGVAPETKRAVEYLDGHAAVTSRALPVLAIPTTAGTGSEMNRAAVLTNLEKRHKDAIRSGFLIPRIALVDPTLTYDLPAEVTAQTGFDALAHAVESYVSRRAQPLADALALQAIETVVAHLPVVLVDPHHPESRTRLSLAATSMGYNLSCVGTCLPHRLDKPLCAQFPDLPHGQAVAFFYRVWAVHSWPGNPDRFARITGLIDPSTLTWPIERAAAACADRLAHFISEIGLGRPPLQILGTNDAPNPELLAELVRGDLNDNPVSIPRDQLAGFFQHVLRPREGHVDDFPRTAEATGPSDQAGGSA